jgi:hypothetical protein
MKAIFGVLFGYALMFVIVGTALAEGAPGASANATSNTRSQGTVDVQDLKVVQGHAESSEELTADANAGASLQAIRDRAKQPSRKALTKLERRLSELANQIDAEANLKGEIFVANRVAPEFGMTGSLMMLERGTLNSSLGDLIIAHTLAANSPQNVTATQLFTLQHDGYTWARIAYGLDLRSDQVAGAVESETRVALGRAKADGRPAMIQSASATRTAASANTGMNAGVNAGGGSVGAGGGAGVGLSIGK